MSVSPMQLQSFVKFVKDHDAFPVFKERVYEKFFRMFLDAKTAQDREEISKTVDCYNGFMKVIYEVIDEMKPVEPVNDTAEDTEHE